MVWLRAGVGGKRRTGPRMPEGREMCMCMCVRVLSTELLKTCE